MAKCTKCDGKGLTGNGDKPWLMEGHVTTCSECAGTGQVSDETVQTQQPVDNKPVEEEKPHGILSIFRRKN